MFASTVFIISTIFTWMSVNWIRQYVIAKQMLDIPTARSSHKIPTPRGGGLGIVFIVLVGMLLLALLERVSWETAFVVFLGGVIAYVGWLDDRHDLSAKMRILVHAIVSIIAMVLIGGMPALDLEFVVLEWQWIGHVIGVIGLVWMINLYNFMDGIDGLAGAEAVFAFSVTGFVLGNSGVGELALVCVLAFGSSLGFLHWNWSPARIFMGDVASGFLGYLIGVLAIMSAHQGFSLWVWLIVLGVFIVDATTTLVRRILNGERWYESHRSHAYQHLANHYGHHSYVTFGVIIVNLLWLMPIALLVNNGSISPLIAVWIALGPLTVLALLVGAGQDRHSTNLSSSKV